MAPVNETPFYGYGIGGRAHHLTAATIVLTILAFLLVANRLFWRIKLMNYLGFDDVFIIIAFLSLMVLGAIMLLAVTHGYGRASSELSPSDHLFAMKMFWISQVLYKVTMNFTKLSLASVYLRLFEKRWVRRTLWTMIGFVSLYGITSIGITIFQCRPMRRAFDKSTPGHCINNTAFWYANGLYNIVTDFVITAVAVAALPELHISKKSKAALGSLFGLGMFVIAASILRMATLKPSSTSKDLSYGTLTSTTWSVVEASLAVVCACVPNLRAPLNRLFPRLLALRTVTNSQQDNIPLRVMAAPAGVIADDE